MTENRKTDLELLIRGKKIFGRSMSQGIAESILDSVSTDEMFRGLVASAV